MDKWLEIEETFLSNNKVWQPEVEPTEYYVIGFECKRQKRGIRRLRCVQTLKGSGRDELDEKLLELVERPDSILIGDQPREYLRYRGEPKPLPKDGSGLRTGASHE